MSMNRWWNLARIALVALLLVMAERAWAEDPGQSSYEPITDQPYLAQPLSPAPSSGNIIGYQPIPNSALPDVTMVVVPASSYGNPESPAVPLGQPSTAAAQPPTGDNQAPYDYTTWLVGDGPYTLGRDDVIHIQVRNQPEFSGAFGISSTGAIQYSYLGDIPVVGMTKQEVEQVIAKLLERYVRIPAVTVTIVGYNSKAVYVIGEVGRPGKYIMRGDMLKLREAIIAAGLPTGSAAMWRTHVIKPDLEKPRIRKVNLKKILYKGKLKDDIDLYPGEIVVVPSTFLSAANRFLSQLLSPITRTATAVALGAL
jgi:polysaccharide export outer membrane protein